MTPEQKKIQELEAKLEQMQREMKKAQTRADALQSQVLNLHATSRSFLDVIVESLVILQSKYPMDAQFQQELWVFQALVQEGIRAAEVSGYG